MRWLFIDTSMSGSIRYGILGSGSRAVHHVQARSGCLLPLLERRYGARLPSRIDGVCAVAGPGSFSSVRGGVLVANLLARVWKKPLVGVSVSDARDVRRLAARLDRGDVSPEAFVAPRYAAEPNITISRNSA